MHEQFKRLVVVFGMPNKPDPKAYLDEFTKAVGTMWPEGVLERAVDRIIAEHDEPFWPAPAKLKALCREECPRPAISNTYADERPHLTDEQMAEQERVMREHKRLQAEHGGNGPDWSVLPDVGREAMETMIANSPNHHLYRRLS